MPERQDEDGICWRVITVERHIARIAEIDDQFPQAGLVLKRTPDHWLGRQHFKLPNDCLRSAAAGSWTFLLKELAATLQPTRCSRRNDQS